MAIQNTLERLEARFTDLEQADFLTELYNALKAMKNDEEFSEQTIKVYTAKEVKPSWKKAFLDTATDLMAEKPKAAEQLKDLAKKFKKQRPEGFFNPIEDFFGYYKNYDPERELPILNIEWGDGHKLTLPEGTFNVIGARPGRGKTSALISIAQEQIRCLLDGKAKIDGIVFISLEEEAREVFRKILASYICGDLEAQGIDIEELDENTRADVAKFCKNVSDITSENYREILEKGTDDKVSYKSKAFAQNFNKIADKILDLYLNKKKLTIYGVEKRNITDIVDIVSYYENNLILLDYTQMAKTKERHAQAYLDMKEISEEIVTAAKESKATVIAGAQLNRDASSKGSSGKGENKEYTTPQQFTDVIIREGDDILTCANVVIAIDKSDEKNFYWKIIKNRNGGGLYNFGYFKHRMDYSFLKSSGNNFLAISKEANIPVAPDKMKRLKGISHNGENEQ